MMDSDNEVVQAMKEMVANGNTKIKFSSDVKGIDGLAPKEVIFDELISPKTNINPEPSPLEVLRTMQTMDSSMKEFAKALIEIMRPWIDSIYAFMDFKKFEYKPVRHINHKPRVTFAPHPASLEEIYSRKLHHILKVERAQKRHQFLTHGKHSK